MMIIKVELSSSTLTPSSSGNTHRGYTASYIYYALPGESRSMTVLVFLIIVSAEGLYDLALLTSPAAQCME